MAVQGMLGAIIRGWGLVVLDALRGRALFKVGQLGGVQHTAAHEHGM